MCCSYAQIQHQLSCDRRHGITPMNQLLIALRFYATGTFQLVVADTVAVHKSTVCHILRHVTAGIAALRPKYVKFPTTADERRATMYRFTLLWACQVSLEPSTVHMCRYSHLEGMMPRYIGTVKVIFRSTCNILATCWQQCWQHVVQHLQLVDVVQHVRIQLNLLHNILLTLVIVHIKWQRKMMKIL